MRFLVADFEAQNKAVPTIEYSANLSHTSSFVLLCFFSVSISLSLSRSATSRCSTNELICSCILSLLKCVLHSFGHNLFKWNLLIHKKLLLRVWKLLSVSRSISLKLKHRVCSVHVVVVSFLFKNEFRTFTFVRQFRTCTICQFYSSFYVELHCVIRRLLATLNKFTWIFALINI